MINIDSLSEILVAERHNAKLQPLPSGFRDEVSAYLQKLLQDANNASNYREQEMLRDEEKNARMMLAGLHDRRLAKILDLATLYHAGVRTLELDGLVGDDHKAFETLHQAISQASSLTRVELA